MHDPLLLRDLVEDELRQRRETGFEIEHIARRLATIEPDPAGLAEFLDELDEAQRRLEWPYDEPDDLPQILDALPAEAAGDLPPVRELEGRVHGAWAGRVAGCNRGKPIEQGEHWTPQRIRSYLEMAGAYPLRDRGRARGSGRLGH
jgi:hypothetical protein